MAPEVFTPRKLNPDDLYHPLQLRYWGNLFWAAGEGVAEGVSQKIDGALESFERAGKAYEAIKETGGSTTEALLMGGAMFAADYTGVADLEEAYEGKELFTNRGLSGGERALKVFSGGTQLAGTAVGVTAAASSFMKPKVTLGGTKPTCNRTGTACFFQGTLVITSQGAREIENIQTGDQVMAFDLARGRWQLAEVINTFQSDFQGFKTIVQCAGESIEATSNHPFWVIEGEDLENRAWPQEMPELPEVVSLPGRWVDAASLRAGDLLYLVNGHKVPVDLVTSIPCAEKVFNLEVAEIHTYAVGRIGVLVHNNEGICPGSGGAVPSKVHGNTAGNQPATLYEKYDKEGVFQKHGITQDPSKRYTQKELDGGYLIEMQTGPRKEILKIERDLVERLPGPQNKEPWAGKRLGE